MDDRPLPLTGVRVLDLGRVYQGPWCGLLLALAGADVIKIEEPLGEPARGRGVEAGTTIQLAMLNSNKRGITLDLKSERGREQFLELVRDADVVLENFGPGTMEDLGLSADLLLEVNPRLIYGAATGYGIDGPDRDALAMDITIQAHGGVMSVTGFPGQPPVKAGVTFVDFLGGTHLYAGIVTALYERERTGLGRIIDVAMIDTIYPTHASNMGAYYRDGVTFRNGNGHGGGAVVPYDVYATSDGFVALLLHNYVPGHAVLVRREAFERAGGLDDRLLYSDWGLSIKLLAQGPAGFVSRPPVAGHRDHGENMSLAATREVNNGRKLEVFRAIDDAAATIGGRLSEPRMRALVRLQRSWHAFAVNEL
ncbi:MAG: hypothetical protein V7636_2102, partial [Actinomycetota bacterium]